MDLDEGDEEFRREVDAVLIPSYILREHPLQEADIELRILSLPDSFRDKSRSG